MAPAALLPIDILYGTQIALSGMSCAADMYNFTITQHVSSWLTTHPFLLQGRLPLMLLT